MKFKKILILFSIAFSFVASAQDLNTLKPLDAELTTVNYPFPVTLKNH